MALTAEEKHHIDRILDSPPTWHRDCARIKAIIHRIEVDEAHEQALRVADNKYWGDYYGKEVERLKAEGVEMRKNLPMVCDNNPRHRYYGDGPCPTCASQAEVARLNTEAEAMRREIWKETHDARTELASVSAQTAKERDALLDWLGCEPQDARRAP